ncbi:hypothetical protein Fcan01_16922 [Folsomia candida]|uniref:Uncharacterized protein n=1 Tax=Folsomia candida TaxID=158441 RepID=A0A226DTG9_FOLCA|nr:hypothetical protein Fcan01_16922 [Folsomia candida]
MFSNIVSLEFSKTIKTGNAFGFPLVWDESTRRNILELSRIYSSFQLQPKLAPNYPPIQLLTNSFSARSMVSDSHLAPPSDALAQHIFKLSRPFLFNILHLLAHNPILILFCRIISKNTLSNVLGANFICPSGLTGTCVNQKTPGSKEIQMFPRTRGAPGTTRPCVSILTAGHDGNKAAFGKYLPIIQTVMGQLAISSGYVFIAEGKKVNVAKRMTFLVCVPSAVLSWAALMTCAAKIQRSAKKCLTSWKVHGDHWESRGDRKYVSKFRKSCKPLYFGWGGFMVVTHKSVLKFMQGIIRGLFRTLLALKKKKK